jgi:hypothetical protein
MGQARERTMTVYRSRSDNQLYILSRVRGVRYTKAPWLESARFDWSRGRIGPWKEVSAGNVNDFVKVCEK